ncbi:MAG: exocyst complex component exo84 [Cirrosporium novae-zelandiae]|nr:MAG: exocyst complex component exo84 [Cirrosporium novae-zelandiae]KAI9735509.1 MAG: exocyst complex component exo84 [Cirrosporium novae-zelandiae]
MEEKEKTSRGLTLRRKGTRKPPKHKAPQISGPLLNTATNVRTGKPIEIANLRERPIQTGGQTADLVKRRYSTRFTQLPDVHNGSVVPPIPSMPTIPQEFEEDTSIPQNDVPIKSGGPVEVDIKALRDPTLQPEKYITNLLSNASEQDIREYQNNLRKIKNRTSADLQQNVYQNRTQFIKISKEAEKLKGEMRTLRNLMSELTNALGQATVSNDTSTASSTFADRTAIARKQANRSSVANLEAMWNTQLQALWKNVERSQKYLPSIPGRHIILETGHWVELDSATWKPRRPIHIFLLNDHLLVSSRKKKRIDPNGPPPKGPIPTKLFAEECWPLQDVDMIDLGSNSGDKGPHNRSIANAISIRVGGKSWTFRHDRPDTNDKNNLLVTFRKTVEELRKSLRAETEGPARARDTLNYLASRDPAISKQAELLGNLADNNLSRDRPDFLIDVDGKQQNLRWVEGQIDELDVDIALQRFAEAVESVEKLRKLAKGLKSNAIAQDIITVKVDERASKLASLVMRRLVDTHAGLNSTQINVSWLTRLGYQDRAREAYLKARSGAIEARSRQCIFSGQLPQYMFEIAFIYFTVIKNTVNVYQKCFPSTMMSACVKWAQGHVQGFNIILVRQLSGVEKGGETWYQCLNLVKEQAKMLSEVGLDFGVMIGQVEA